MPGDDPAVIGSGPTVADPVSNAEALAIAERYATARSARRGPCSRTRRTRRPKPGDPVFARSAFRIVMTPAEMLARGRHRGGRAGLCAAGLLGADLEGEAREVAAAQARLAREVLARGGRTAILSGGELTVTIRGQGRGGARTRSSPSPRAVELGGLAGVSAPRRRHRRHRRRRRRGDRPGRRRRRRDHARPRRRPRTRSRRELADNDSTGFFEALGDLVAPGPTFTNVNDLRVILVDGTAA